jgi:phosphate uptake regulator
VLDVGNEILQQRARSMMNRFLMATSASSVIDVLDTQIRDEDTKETIRSMVKELHDRLQEGPTTGAYQVFNALSDLALRYGFGLLPLDLSVPL